MTELVDRVRSALADCYTIEREVGRGGMATVFLAQDLRHHRPVAVKVLHPQLAVRMPAPPAGLVRDRARGAGRRRRGVGGGERRGASLACRHAYPTRIGSCAAGCLYT